MIRSMTGFGAASVQVGNKTITVELKSVNSKFFDLSLRLPSLFRDKELELRNELSKSLERGKAECIITVDSTEQSRKAYFNTELIRTYHSELLRLKKELKLTSTPDMLRALLSMPDVLVTEKSASTQEEVDAMWSAVKKAVAAFDSFRHKEGKALAKDLEQRIQSIAQNTERLAPFEKARIEHVRQKLKAGLEEWMNTNDIDRNRFEQELIFYIEKLDINEEKVRLASHGDFFLKAMKEESSGKKLGFIAQEIGREINTIGSKANQADMQRIVVEMKDDLEKSKNKSSISFDMSGKLLLFCGPSGSGKTTIVHHLLKKDKRLCFSVSATTRPMRSNEQDGVDYHFLSVDEFKKKISNHAFIEWEEVYTDRFYGTLKSEVGGIWLKQQVAVFDVDVVGGLNIKGQFGGDLLSVFVMPPSVEELHRRLKARNSETAESYQARISKAEHELTFASHFDKIIVNDSLEAALQEAESIVAEFLGSPTA